MRIVFFISNFFKRKIIPVIGMLILLILAGCSDSSIPKPKAYFRIALPEKEYKPIIANFPYEFEIPTYSVLIPDSNEHAEPFWANLYFARFNAGIHLTYKPIQGNIANLLEDSRTMAYKHSIKADAIDEKIFVNDSTKIFGTVYIIQGNTASQVQFYITDSVKHFLRGALYFSNHPNKDSLAPVVNFLTDDIVKLIETTWWKAKK